jgi:glycerophosphoryl diester phosphodiesterase
MLIAGHRGAMAHAPENSLESYALAEQIGVDEIELDVRLSADQELFLLHDGTLDRTAGDDSARDRGPVAELTLSELRAVVLDSGRGVVTLAEMYDATSTAIQLEIKADATVPYLAEFFAARPADAERTVLTSFHQAALREAAERMPQIDRGIITGSLAKAEEFEGGWRGLLQHTRSARFACGFPGMTAEAAAAIREQGIDLHLWPARTAEDVRTAVEFGADGITADDPAAAQQWLAEITGARGSSA